MKIGTASYGFTQKKYYKMKEGEVVFRILPPLGSLADSGQWSKFYDVHYGYTNSKGKLRPFQSPLVKNYKTKMIEVPDAALERIEKLKAALEEAKAKGDTVAIGKLDELVGQKGKFNLDKNHYMNVVDLQGNIGILKLRHKAKVALDSAIKSLREKGIDPLSVEDGRFFIFRRTGSGRDTAFAVEVYKETLNVPGVGDVQRDVVHKLSGDLINRLSKEAADLDKLFKRPTADEVARIVKEGSRAVDEILDAKSSNGDEGGDYDDGGYDEDSSSSSAPTSAAAPASVAAEYTMRHNGDGSATATEVKTAPEGSNIVPGMTVPATPATTPAAAPTNTAVADMTEDEFLKSIGM